MASLAAVNSLLRRRRKRFTPLKRAVLEARRVVCVDNTESLVIEEKVETEAHSEQKSWLCVLGLTDGINWEDDDERVELADNIRSLLSGLTSPHELVIWAPVDEAEDISSSMHMSFFSRRDAEAVQSVWNGLVLGGETLTVQLLDSSTALRAERTASQVYEQSNRATDSQKLNAAYLSSSNISNTEWQWRVELSGILEAEWSTRLGEDAADDVMEEAFEELEEIVSDIQSLCQANMNSSIDVDNESKRGRCYVSREVISLVDPILRKITRDFVKEQQSQARWVLIYSPVIWNSRGGVLADLPIWKVSHDGCSTEDVNDIVTGENPIAWLLQLPQEVVSFSNMWNWLENGTVCGISAADMVSWAEFYNSDTSNNISSSGPLVSITTQNYNLARYICRSLHGLKLGGEVVEAFLSAGQNPFRVDSQIAYEHPFEVTSTHHEDQGNNENSILPEDDNRLRCVYYERSSIIPSIDEPSLDAGAMEAIKLASAEVANDQVLAPHRRHKEGQHAIVPQLSPELCTQSEQMLQSLDMFETRSRARKKFQRRLVAGMKQCTRLLRANRVRLLLVAPNTDAVEAVDTSLSNLINLAISRGVPVAYGPVQRRLGRAAGYKIKQSVVAVLDANGIYEIFIRIVRAVDASGQRNNDD